MKWIHLPVTWAKWWVVPNLKASRIKVCDGFYLKGVLSDTPADENPDAVIKYTRILRGMGYKVIPGMVIFIGEYKGNSNLSAWYDTKTWQRAAQVALKFSPLSKNISIDFEPYWEGNRYPPVEDVRKLSTALYPLIRTAKTKKLRLHLLPGIHYTLGAVLLSALPGQIVDCDESCYAYGDPARRQEVAQKRGYASWDEDVSKRAKGATLMGVEYRPGFYYKGINDPTLQLRLNQPGSKNMCVWYYPNSKEAQVMGKS